jgi:hypothetical protein
MPCVHTSDDRLAKLTRQLCKATGKTEFKNLKEMAKAAESEKELVTL